MFIQRQSETFLPDEAVREIFAQSIYASFRPSYPYRDKIRRWFLLSLTPHSYDDDRSTF